MTKKKIAQKKSVAKKATVKNIKCCSSNPNFLLLLLAGTIIAFAFLFSFL